MTPTVGRGVHYVSHGSPVLLDGTQAHPSRCRAAVITEVCPDGDPDGDACASLAVLNPTGLFFDEHIGLDDGAPPADERDATHLCGGRHYRPGTWHWPERT